MNKGEVWFVEFSETKGHEQTGKRPAIVLAELEANIAIVIPLTSNLQALRFPHTIEISPTKENGLSTNSIALVFHVRAIDKSRLTKKLGSLENKLLVEMDNILRNLLKL